MVAVRLVVKPAAKEPGATETPVKLAAEVNDAGAVWSELVSVKAAMGRAGIWKRGMWLRVVLAVVASRNGAMLPRRVAAPVPAEPWEVRAIWKAMRSSAEGSAETISQTACALPLSE